MMTVFSRHSRRMLVGTAMLAMAILLPGTMALAQTASDAATKPEAPPLPLPQPPVRLVKDQVTFLAAFHLGETVAVVRAAHPEFQFTDTSTVGRSWVAMRSFGPDRYVLQVGTRKDGRIALVTLSQIKATSIEALIAQLQPAFGMPEAVDAMEGIKPVKRWENSAIRRVGHMAPGTRMALYETGNGLAILQAFTVDKKGRMAVD